MSTKNRIVRKHRILIYLMIIFVTSYFLNILLRLQCVDLFRNMKRKITRKINIPDDTSCYAEDKSENIMKDEYNISHRSIYLISTSCDSVLPVHRACVIESVMNAHNPSKKIHVLFTKPIEECACSGQIVQALKHVPQINFVDINIHRYVENTPLRGIFQNNFTKIGVEINARVAEILKIATLYKYGGVVLDIDMIMAKPVDYLGPNWGVKSNGSQIGSAGIALSGKTFIGEQMLKKSIQILKEQQNEKEISAGLAVSEAFRQACYGKPIRGCSTFRLYDTEYFYPINESSSHLMFRKGNLRARTYGYYIWDTTDIFHARGSLYIQLMREYCPNVATYLDV